MEEQAQGLSGTELSQASRGSICSGLEVETDQTAQCICPTQNITETDPEEPFPNVHCASTNNTAQNPNQA